jgi:hypothetical protein
MIVFLLILSILFCLTTIAAAVWGTYWYAEAKSNRRYILKQEERIKDLKNDAKEWCAKLLVKNGQTPLGYKPTPKDPKPERDVTREPNVVLRRQAAERATPKDDDLLAKAKQIIDLRTDT